MPRFRRFGRFTVNASLAHKITGLEEAFTLDDEDAKALRAYLDKHVQPWLPVKVGPHPRGPIHHDRPSSSEDSIS